MTRPRFYALAGSLLFVLAFAIGTTPVETASAQAPPVGSRAAREASQAARQSKQLTATFVGADTCLGCHDDKAKTLERTVHGKAAHPRSPAAAQGCEAVTARFRPHRGSGRPDDHQAVRPDDGAAGRQRDVPVVPHEVVAHAVAGERARHAKHLMRNVSQRAHASGREGSAEDGERARAVRLMSPNAGDQGQACVAHAALGRQDGVQLLP